jgi:hypothetical protein
LVSDGKLILGWNRISYCGLYIIIEAVIMSQFYFSKFVWNIYGRVPDGNGIVKLLTESFGLV